MCSEHVLAILAVKDKTQISHGQCRNQLKLKFAKVRLPTIHAPAMVKPKSLLQWTHTHSMYWKEEWQHAFVVFSNLAVRVPNCGTFTDRG